MNFEESKQGYANLWAKMMIKADRVSTTNGIAMRLSANEKRYQTVASFIGCPWWFIAIIHNLESGADFSKHLHNGDPLTSRTVRVPAGRPPVGSPPFTWETSAADAMTMPAHAFDRVTDWSIPHCLFLWEKYNGWGYLGKIRSPYLWSFTNLEEPGKYIADHIWDPNAVSKQCGAAAILRAMMDLKIIVKDDPMSELRDFISQFKLIAPTLVTVIAGPVAGLAVRAIAEALTNETSIDTGSNLVPADPKVIVDKLETSPISSVISVLAAAEQIITMITTKEPTPIVVTAPTPVVVVPSTPPSEVTTTVETKPETPEETNALDRMFPSLVGWKTTIAIGIYVLGNVAAIFAPTIVTPEILQGLTWLAGGLGGAGLIAKFDRYLAIFKPTVKTTTVLTK